jgi:thiol-disulfide isomerase/thioredoxin
MKKLLFLCFFSILFSFLQAQNNHHLEFTLNGFQFDTLRIAALNASTREGFFFWGKTNDKSTWTFEMPDSLWNNMDGFVLGYGNDKKKKYGYVHFYDKTNNPSSVSDVHITPDLGNVRVKANLFSIDSVVEDGCTLINYNFLAIPDKSSGLEAMIRYPDFSSFFSDSIAYKEQLNRYIDAVKDCPNSKFLAEKMSELLSNYRSVNDARLVYDNFSDSIKRTDYGKEIEVGLTQDWTKFENVALKNVLTGKDERIVQDSIKYTLVCFTASWCSWCRKEIPLLKEIYKDLKDYPFEMEYVTVDKDEQYMSAFKKQVIEDSIPWRSLFSYPLNIDIKYHISGYPTSMLVYPDRHIEFMDVRDEAKRNKLYKLVKGYS